MSSSKSAGFGWPVLRRAILGGIILAGLFLPTSEPGSAQAPDKSGPSALDSSHNLFGFMNFSEQAKIDREFLSVPDPKQAKEELKTLTMVPHVAGSKEDYATAVYVAGKFKAAGLETQIVEYTAWMNLPEEVYVQASSADGTVLMTGPSREHVEKDSFQDDSRILPAFHGSSPGGDVTADVIYANYGTPEDFKHLEQMHMDVRGKIVMVRYGSNFRGVKVYLAQQHGAAGVIIYSDPADDGYFQGDQYPNGPWRPKTAVQRGSVEYLFKYSGDATTPGIASTADVPPGKRLSPAEAASLPSIPSMPLSYHDASPILKHLGGPEAPRSWQGALPFTYHVGGAGAVAVHMRLKMDYAQRPIWDVIGRVPGATLPGSWVVTGNHRDAWVFGAADPGSGSVALLEAVRGVGALLRKGWKPHRTMYFCSWDAEEEGLIGSTEWAEDHAAELENAVAYFNTDVAVSGSRFQASSVPSLQQFLREIAMEVPSPKGGTLYQQWTAEENAARLPGANLTGNPLNDARSVSQIQSEARVGDLGSGSDYTPFLQHLGVPSTDIGTVGPYGVYHSAFDDYSWFVMNADPNFTYEQEIARFLGLEALHMAQADVLPYDYVTYGRQVLSYLHAAESSAKQSGLDTIDFSAAISAADRFRSAAGIVYSRQLAPEKNPESLNASLRKVEEDLLTRGGLPGRPWYKHAIFAPGEYTGYAAVVIPGVTEAISAGDANLAQSQLANVTSALNRAAATLEAVR